VPIVLQRRFLTTNGTEVTEELKDQWLAFYWRYSLARPRLRPLSRAESFIFSQRHKELFLAGFASLREQFLKLDSFAKIVSTQGF
jgi:hypothetical protein